MNKDSFISDPSTGPRTDKSQSIDVKQLVPK